VVPLVRALFILIKFRAFPDFEYRQPYLRSKGAQSHQTHQLSWAWSAGGMTENRLVCLPLQHSCSGPAIHSHVVRTRLPSVAAVSCSSCGLPTLAPSIHSQAAPGPEATAAQKEWVECTRCGKWRIVTPEHLAWVTAQGESYEWYCEVAGGGMNCSVPQAPD
jgi:hypothetical protein